MTLSEFGVKNRYTVYALFIAILIFGAVSYFSLPVQLFPDTAPPLVNILTSYPGAAAEDVADLVSDPIETEAAALEGVAAISSTSQNGLSLVTVEFRYGTSVDLAAVDVQNALSRIRSRLPREMADPQVLKFSTSARPILTMGLRGEDPAAVRRLAEDVFGPEIQRVPGVAVVAAPGRRFRFWWTGAASPPTGFRWRRWRRPSGPTTWASRRARSGERGAITPSGWTTAAGARRTWGPSPSPPPRDGGSGWRTWRRLFPAAGRTPPGSGSGADPPSPCRS